MKTKTILIALFLLCIKTQAQSTDKVILKDFEILTNDVLKINENSYSYSAISKSFSEPISTVDAFDSKGYVIERIYNNSAETQKKYTYDANYKKATKTFVESNSKYNYVVEKLPFGSILLKVNESEVLKNADGSIKQVLHKGKKENIAFNYSSNGNIVTIKPSVSGLNTQRTTKDGLLLSEEGDIMSTYFAYDSTTKLQSQKISAIKNVPSNVYSVYVYEFDKKGNWIVKYELGAVPSYGKIGNALRNIVVRELTYKDKSKTGYTSISEAMKSKAVSMAPTVEVAILDTKNPYSYPIFMNFDNKGLLKTNNNSASTTTDSKCEGDCQNGWGKYTYDNGYYEGFWLNGKKSGYGIYVWSESDTYLGNWRENKMDGFGQSVFASGNEYVGGYSNGKYEGYAIYYNKAKDKNEFNKYSNGSFVSATPMESNGVSVGCTHGNCANGYGRYVFDNGGIFIGEFINNGLAMGIFYFKNGDIYQGLFNPKTNKFHGYGYYSYKETGDFYKGNWSESKYNGNGLSYTKNKYYKNEWKDNEPIKSY